MTLALRLCALQAFLLLALSTTTHVSATSAPHNGLNKPLTSLPGARNKAKPPTTTDTGRTSVPFDYGWRFHFGHGPDDAPGPGNTTFAPLHTQDICNNVEHNPNRFTAEDCMLACAYNPECMLWQQSGDGGSTCFHGKSDAVCNNSLSTTEGHVTGTSGGKSDGLIGDYVLKAGGIRYEAPPLKTDYKFSERDYDDSSWWRVDLPHDFVVNNSFVETPDNRHGFLPRNVSWYRKHFLLPKDWSGSHIYLHFEGVFHVAQIWINGQYLQMHTCGYTGFTLRLDNLTDLVYASDGSDIPNADHLSSKILAARDNVIVVRSDASFGSGHWYEGGGIYRRVHLVRTDPVHFVHDGVFVSPEVDWSAPVIHATAEFEATHAITTESSNVSVTFTLLDGNTVLASNTTYSMLPGAGTNMVHATLSVQGEAGLEPWSIQSPRLYLVQAAIAVVGAAQDESPRALAGLVPSQSQPTDSVNVTVGFRQTSWSTSKGFTLNNKPLKFRGFSHHNSFAGLGTAIPERVYLFRVQASRAVGGSIWRMSHNPYLTPLYDMLDTLGVLSWDENRDYGLEYVPEMHDMVKRDRSHPSIIIWSFCNEYECHQFNNQTGLSFRAAAKALDPWRPTGANGDTNGIDVQGFSHADNSTFINFHNQFPDTPLVLSECCSCTSQRLDRAESVTCMRDQNSPGLLPYVTGSLGVWTLFDYYGESHEWPAVSCSYGNFDLTGFPKPHAYWYQVNWLALRDVQDAGRPPVKTASASRILDLAQMVSDSVNAVTSAAKATLYKDGKKVSTQAPDVAGAVVTFHLSECHFPRNLSGVQCHGLQNDQSATSAEQCEQACCDASDCNTWQFANEKGCWIGNVDPNTCTSEKVYWVGGGRDLPGPASFTNLTLVGEDTNGKPTSHHTVLMPGKPFKLQLHLDVPSPATGTGTSLVLDGHDGALVGVSVADKAGTVVTNATARVTFTVRGPGRLTGVGNGNDTSHDAAKGSTIPTYAGWARAVVQVSVDCVSPGRSLLSTIDVDSADVIVRDSCTSTNSTIQIEASAPGLQSATLSIPLSTSTDDLPLAVARRSVEMDKFSFLDDFVG